ncbi:hypothetical protein [Phenylobacterium sp. LH3H17]|nr:hypothetical protein [Phenylobacterium sp. LH3H17]
MLTKPPSYVGLSFYNLLDEEKFRAARDQMIEQIKARPASSQPTI